MMTVNEVARRAGVSGRTLRYYDQLGLLRPVKTTEAGYRLYDEADLKRLQRILFLKELEIPLKQIKPMLAMEEGNEREALRRHREILRLKAERLMGLMNLCDRVAKGEAEMNLDEFNPTSWETERDRYANEAQERWGGTKAWQECEKRTARYGKQEWQNVNDEGKAILQAFGALVGHSPTSPEVRAALDRWQRHISERFYPCTDEILAGLGQMYVADERFRRNLNANGEGTAELMSEAIRRRNE